VFQVESDGASAAVSGAVVRVSLQSRVRSSGFAVPTAALVRGSRGLWSLYVVTDCEGDEGVIKKRDVEVIHTEGDESFVRGTLVDGEIIVVVGVHRVVPGQKVQLISDDNVTAIGNEGAIQ